MMKKRWPHASPPQPEQKPENRADLAYLPIDGRTGQPMLPGEQPGYYPGFHTLDQQAFWDEATRKVVLDRVQRIPPVRFFTPEEACFMQAVCARLMPQDDRDEAHQIPIVQRIDERLYEGRGDGYRYEDMPPDTEVYHLGLRAIDAVAHCLYGHSFVELSGHAQDHVLQTIHDEQPPAAAGMEIWQQMSIIHFWGMLLSDVIEAYYAHPYAWDEIGFGGPAYPRGYMRLEGGQPEPWEVKEQRYRWQAPPTALSDVLTYPSAEKKFQMHSGQEGTH